MPPLARVGCNDVHVPVEQEGWRLTSAGNASDEVGPLDLERDIAMLDSGLLEQATYELQAGSLVARRVRGVEPDERLEQLDVSHGDPHVQDSSALHHLPVDSREQHIR
jgi:hypothetical protein